MIKARFSPRRFRSRRYGACKCDILSVQSQKVSLMPDQLLRDATAQQAADLLTFLQSLK